jgi:NAD(P)-dependent dehydrogenase (short-subunit alcohol dehydrogenase family)
MVKQQSGSIINISSIAAVIAKGGVAYCASKAGVNSLTLTVAMDTAKYGVRVNAIMPGAMNTPMAIPDKLDKDAKEDLIRRRDLSVPLKGGQGSGWDTAYAALFLASDEAKFITAAVLPVDGGASASAMCLVDFH